MDVFDLIGGVAAGILLAAMCLGSFMTIHRHEKAGTEGPLWLYGCAVFPLALIVLTLIANSTPRTGAEPTAAEHMRADPAVSVQAAQR